MTKSITCLAVAAVVAATCGVLRAQGPAATSTDLRAFVGTWKEDQSKSRPFISSALTYTFTAEPDGFVTIVRGRVQLRDRVRLDGTDYPTSGVEGRTVSWMKVNDTLYESSVKRNGSLLGTARRIISDDGKHLRQETTPVRANGDNDLNIVEYVRAGGTGKGLLGEWKPVSSRSAVPDLFIVTLMDDELYVFYPKYGSTLYTMRLDGKRYQTIAPNALPDMTTAAESVGVRSLRRTTFQAGKPTLEIVMTVSDDGQTMTVSTHTPGSADEPSFYSYEKKD
jgi:hypothetical protein